MQYDKYSNKQMKIIIIYLKIYRIFQFRLFLKDTNKFKPEFHICFVYFIFSYS
jgi:hypothetical protein